jgi:uncharacterized protein YqjF (DUF2071 family)
MRQHPQHDANEPTGALRSWVWSQQWRDVLFLHWQVPAAALRSHIPAPLEIATTDGGAWVSLVLFHMRVRLRWLPYLPGLSELAEVNLRTYVRFQDKPGICFLSVHADNRGAIYLAKRLTPMPYVWANLEYQRHGEGFRVSGNQPSSEDFRLALAFSPDAAEQETPNGTLDSWLLERYRLFIEDRQGRLLQAEVNHPPWSVRRVDVSVVANTLGEKYGVDLSRAPDRAHFSTGVQARFGAFQRLETTRPCETQGKNEPQPIGA